MKPAPPVTENAGVIVMFGKLPATRSPALPADVKFRAERKLGGRAEALAPQQLRESSSSLVARKAVVFPHGRGSEVEVTGDKIAGTTG